MADWSNNPFRIVEDDSRRDYIGSSEHGPLHVSPQGYNTFIIPVAESSDDLSDPVCEPSGTAVMILDGVLWAPPVGTQILLSEPRRWATVVRQGYEVLAGQFSSMVYVTDPAMR